MAWLIKSTVAGTVAWEAATLIHSRRPVLASLGALLVVPVSVRRSWSTVSGLVRELDVRDGAHVAGVAPV